MKVLKMENSNKNQDLLVILIETDDEMFLSHTAKGLVFQLKLSNSPCVFYSQGFTLENGHGFTLKKVEKKKNFNYVTIFFASSSNSNLQ